MVSNRARRCIVRCPESDCRGGCGNIAKDSEKNVNYVGGGTLQFRLTRRRTTYYLAAAAHSRLAAVILIYLQRGQANDVTVPTHYVRHHDDVIPLLYN